MKIARMFAAAGLVVASLGVATVADAQNHRGEARYDRDHRGDRGDRYDRDRGRHYGRDRHQQRCRVEWRHHHRVRICR